VIGSVESQFLESQAIILQIFSQMPDSRFFAECPRTVRESRMAGAHATMWIANRMPDWLYFGDFDLVSKQIEMAGARSKWFGDFNARIEMDRNRSK
jgi:hypothetical protein